MKGHPDPMVRLHVRLAVHWRTVSLRLGQHPVESSRFRRWMRVHARLAADAIRAHRAGATLDTRGLSLARMNQGFPGRRIGAARG